MNYSYHIACFLGSAATPDTFRMIALQLFYEIGKKSAWLSLQFVSNFCSSSLYSMTSWLLKIPMTSDMRISSGRLNHNSSCLMGMFSLFYKFGPISLSFSLVFACLLSCFCIEVLSRHLKMQMDLGWRRLCWNFRTELCFHRLFFWYHLRRCCYSLMVFLYWLSSSCRREVMTF